MAEGRFFGRLRAGLQKTRQALTESLGAVFSRKRIDAETLEELEEALILADLGAQTTEKILQEVTKRVKQKTIEAGEGLQTGVIETVRDILLASTPVSATDLTSRPRPWVLLMVGVNGIALHYEQCRHFRPIEYELQANFVLVSRLRLVVGHHSGRLVVPVLSGVSVQCR